MSDPDDVARSARSSQVASVPPAARTSRRRTMPSSSARNRGQSMPGRCGRFRAASRSTVSLGLWRTRVADRPCGREAVAAHDRTVESCERRGDVPTLRSTVWPGARPNCSRPRPRAPRSEATGARGASPAWARLTGSVGPLRSSWRQRPRWYGAGWVALMKVCTIFTNRSGWSLWGKWPAVREHLDDGAGGDPGDVLGVLDRDDDVVGCPRPRASASPGSGRPGRPW